MRTFWLFVIAVILSVLLDKLDHMIAVLDKLNQTMIVNKIDKK